MTLKRPPELSIHTRRVCYYVDKLKLQIRICHESGGSGDLIAVICFPGLILQLTHSGVHKCSG